MTIGHARSVMSLLWVISTCPLFLIFILQSILGKYGNEWDMPWNWFIPLVVPILSLIIGVWIIDREFNSREHVRSAAVFWDTMCLSILYILAIYLVVL